MYLNILLDWIKIQNTFIAYLKFSQKFSRMGRMPIAPAPAPATTTAATTTSTTTTPSPFPEPREVAAVVGAATAAMMMMMPCRSFFYMVFKGCVHVLYPWSLSILFIYG